MNHDRSRGLIWTSARARAFALGRTMMLPSATAWLLLGALGCATKTVAPLPESVHRIVVLPPKGPVDAPPAVSVPAELTVPDVVAAAARLQLAEKGYEVVDPVSVEAVTKGRRP